MNDEDADYEHLNTERFPFNIRNVDSNTCVSTFASTIQLTSRSSKLKFGNSRPRACVTCSQFQKVTEKYRRIPCDYDASAEDGISAWIVQSMNSTRPLVNTAAVHTADLHGIERRLLLAQKITHCEAIPSSRMPHRTTLIDVKTPIAPSLLVCSKLHERKSNAENRHHDGKRTEEALRGLWI